MTNPESPDYAALIERLARARLVTVVMDGSEICYGTEIVAALRALLKERDELQIMLGAEKELVKEMQSCAVTQHNKLEQYDKALEAGLKTLNQTLLEVSHAQQSGSQWYTRGEGGLYNQVSMWVRRGSEAIKEIERIRKL